MRGITFLLLLLLVTACGSGLPTEDQLKAWAEADEYLKIAAYVAGTEATTEDRIEAIWMLGEAGHDHRMRKLVRDLPDPAGVAAALVQKALERIKAAEEPDSVYLVEIFNLHEYMTKEAQAELRQSLAEEIDRRVDWSGDRDQIWNQVKWFPLHHLDILEETGGELMMKLTERDVSTDGWRFNDQVRDLSSLESVGQARLAKAMRAGLERIIRRCRGQSDDCFSRSYVLAVSNVRTSEARDILVWLSRNEGISRRARQEAEKATRHLSELLGGGSE